MDFNEFTGEVQHRIEAATQGEAVRAIRAVLQTLGERLEPGEASDLASPLPMEIDRYILDVDHGQRFDYDEFVDRIEARMNYDDLDVDFGKGGDVDRSDINFYATAIVALVVDQLSGDEPNQLAAQLPDDYGNLFEFVDAESEPWDENE